MTSVDTNLATAITLANHYLRDMSEEELKQYAFDRLVDELSVEGRASLERQLAAIAEPAND